MLDQLFDHYQIAIVGFDVVVAERDESSGIKVLQQLAQNELRDDSQLGSALKRIEPELDYDQRFARSMRDRALVLGYLKAKRTVPRGAPLKAGAPRPPGA